MSDREPGRLQEFFASGDTSASRWEELWKANYSPWDRGQPSPALHDCLLERVDLVGSSAHIEAAAAAAAAAGGTPRRRERALVPGCGRGHDVLLLAAFGYDAVGLDGAETAVQEARELMKTSWGQYEAVGQADEKGDVSFVTGDFFEDGWREETQSQHSSGKFDLIYDYTFFCALNPAMRPAWAARMSELLSPTGRLVCLEFPLYKDRGLAGPPFPVRGDDYLAYLASPGEELQIDGDGSPIPATERSPRGLIRLDRWLAERTHKSGEGTDHVSVWSHANT